MKRCILFFIALTIASYITAQDRFIARGADPGELYIDNFWYGIYNPAWGPPYYDTLRSAFYRLTENGKKIAIQYDVDYFADPADIMIPHYILADATPGVVYNKQFSYKDDGYTYTQLWVSFDYGKNWEMRDDSKYVSGYIAANVEGIIYRAHYKEMCKSWDYGETFIEMEDPQRPGGEPCLEDCEFYSLGSNKSILHTYDCFQTYTDLPLENEEITLLTDICRGGLPGEVYVTNGYQGGVLYKIFFSTDAGNTFRKILASREGTFMSDRKAGDFYFVSILPYETEVPWGFYYRICITYYTDYGETRVGAYCHELQRHYPSVNCQGIMSLQASIEDKNSVRLSWEAPETGTVTAYHLYRKDVLIKELQGTSYTDEDLPDGDYTYYIKALYADGCETLSYNVVTMTVGSAGIVETQGIASIRIYPNPTSGELKVESGEWKIENVEIFDLMGKCVGVYPCGRPVGETIIDIFHLPTGMYFVRILTNEGAVTKKIIKQ